MHYQNQLDIKFQSFPFPQVTLQNSQALYLYVLSFFGEEFIFYLNFITLTLKEFSS